MYTNFFRSSNGSLELTVETEVVISLSELLLSLSELLLSLSGLLLSRSGLCSTKLLQGDQTSHSTVGSDY